MYGGRVGAIAISGLCLAAQWLAAAPAPVLAQTAADSPRAPESRIEARGLWATRWEIATPAGVDIAVSAARLLGMNMLILQVVAEGEAYYDSDVLPRAASLPPGFDPLAYAIERADSAGIEVHAWINVFSAGSMRSLSPDPAHPLRVHPEWVTADRWGRLLWNPAAYAAPEAAALPGLMFDPALDAVHDFILRIVTELLDRYDLEGIHLDYVRYPSPAYGYHPTARFHFWSRYGEDPVLFESDPNAFRREHGPASYDALHGAWLAWRRDRVTSLVRRIHATLKAEKPWVSLSAAVFADAAVAFNDKLQDWHRWLAEGLVDFVAPMAYSVETPQVRHWAEQAVQASAGRHVYVGLAAYQLAGDPAALVEQIKAVRRAGADGVLLFSSRSLTDRLPTLRALIADPFRAPATMPPMPWKCPAEVPCSSSPIAL
ncbi:MAG TPA: family 10 glycosylhydrolase [Limnochordia bacterium]